MTRRPTEGEEDEKLSLVRGAKIGTCTVDGPMIFLMGIFTSLRPFDTRVRGCGSLRRAPSGSKNVNFFVLIECSFSSFLCPIMMAIKGFWESPQPFYGFLKTPAICLWIPAACFWGFQQPVKGLRSVVLEATATVCFWGSMQRVSGVSAMCFRVMIVKVSGLFATEL